MILALIFAALSILLAGIAIGTGIARMNPTREVPVRLVKVRGDVVDMVV